MNKEPFTREKEQYFLVDKWYKDDALVAGFTTRVGGESKGPYDSFNLGLHVGDNRETVNKNRTKLAHLLQFPTSKWVCTEQIHDNHIRKVTQNDCGKGVHIYEESIKGTDGIYTDEKNILLTSAYADCVPLFFYEPSKKLIGLAHAGWKGTVKNIGGNMVQHWVEKEKVNPKNILVTIGPAIGACCYVVDDRVIDKVNNVITDDFKPYEVLQNNQYKLDLKALNYYLLLESGIQNENITISSFCTSCDEGNFFSHRRDKGTTGRMLSFIGFTK